jgi:predicted Fe-Mo cluster-binding NifX family protein
MKVAVSSLGSSLDAWIDRPFGMCSQFVIVDTDSMDFFVISVPPEQRDPDKVSLYAIRALANQEVQTVITGQIKDICRQAMSNLGIEVVDGIQRMTVRQAVESYLSQGAQAVQSFEPPSVRIAVASHGTDLDAAVSGQAEPCTSFILVDPQSMEFEVIDVNPGESPEQTSVNAVRAAARAGATVVITPQVRPACCAALRTLAIDVALSSPDMTVRQAVEAYRRDQLQSPPYTWH